MFRRATLRLTISYSLIQLGIFGAFAFGVYFFVTGTFDFDAAEHDGEDAVIAAEQGFALLRTALLISFGILVLVVPVASWLMARAALTPIEVSYDRQRQFVDGASHEMRTPLSVIQGELELALTGRRTPAQYRSAMTAALEATASLITLTNDLLELSRTSEPDQVPASTRIDLADLLRSVVAAASPAAEAREIRIVLVEPPEATATLAPELLTRAIGNVVDNAVKYSDIGSQVTVTAEVSESAITIDVSDDGDGMTATQLQRAFDRFWRADDARTTPGHGLGLPLVKQVVEAHGGTVDLRSTVGIGTQATIMMPRM
jgi:signal transduction histidine kinase